MPTDETRRTVDVPHDRLTRICDAMTKTRTLHPESRPDDRCIVFLADPERGGLVTDGYEADDNEAIVDLLMHLQAIFRANGKHLEIVAIPDDTSGLDDG